MVDPEHALPILKQAEEFEIAFAGAMAQRGPMFIEAVI